MEVGELRVDVKWEMMLEKIKEVVKRRSVRRMEGRRRKWWDGECRK